MKLIREYVCEKFEQDSDPIHDMKIGIFTEKDFESDFAAAKFVFKFLPDILQTNKIPSDILDINASTGIATKYYMIIRNYKDNYITVNGYHTVHFWKNLCMILKNRKLYKK
jgi:hypothetical protein